MQGIACKKYIETVGDAAASQKPIGTGPYKLVESKSGSSFKFEALDRHWRVVPEFKILTLLLVPEVSTVVAMLKTKEIDLAAVPAEQLSDLKAGGLSTEVSSVGGCILGLVWGGICIPEDSRYDASYYNKDPWVDVRVRKAMSLAIDRQAICKAVFAEGAIPTGATLFSQDMDKYQYPYDPAAARQLLKEAGYPGGFSFKAISYELRGVPETPRLMEALAGYWQQIGLDPQITPVDYTAYSVGRNALKIAGEVSIMQVTMRADMLDYCALHFMPDCIVYQFQDEESFVIWQEGSEKVNIDERNTCVDKLNQHFYENFNGSIVKKSYCYAWNPATISPFPHSGADAPMYLEYVRHTQPLNTFRLFTPWEGR